MQNGIYKIHFIPNIETWAQIDGFNDYQVSNFGRFRNCTNGHILNKIKDDASNEYKKVKLKKNNETFFLKSHKIVAETFIYNPHNKPLIDHIDGNKANNHVSNLRWATYSENAMNRTKANKNNGLKYKGVVFNGKVYQAMYRLNGKRHHIGSFKTEDEAGEAYNNAVRQVFGEFAKLNIIE